MRLSCVVYFLMVERAESSFGASPGGVEYIRAVSLCSPLFRFVFLYSVSPFVSSCVPFCVSFVRLVLRAVHASRRGVSFCVPFSLLVVGHNDPTFVWAPFRSACRLSSRLASRVRRLRFSLYAVRACRSSFLSCVSFRSLTPFVSSCRLVLYAVSRFCSAFPLCVLSLRAAFLFARWMRLS